jgi:chromosome segregation protein
MYGFKSFARPTRLEFPRGITALVGPNGTGKSNVVDAVRWSLGEQSVRDLRGQRAVDVIYAGPRRVLGAAEVSLTVEESEGDDRCPEICISRRLYRSGDSEYLLSRRKARLKDVLETMREIGIDAGRRVIVTQGMADSLLSASPLERRAIIEQAAGLIGYRERRDEARHKLSAIAQNIATTEMVLAELEPRLRMVRRQARAVEERDEASRRLKIGLSAWYRCRWQEIESRVKQTQEAAGRLASARATLAAELAGLEEEAERALHRERAWHQRIEAAIAALYLAEREQDGMRREIEYLEQRRASARSGLSECDAQAGRLESMKSAVEQRLLEACRAMAEIRAVRAAKQGEVSRLTSQLEARRAELARAERSALDIRQTRDAAEQRHQEVVDQSCIAQSEMERHTARREGLDSSIRGHDASLGVLEAELSGLETELSSAMIDEAACASGCQDRERKLDGVRDRLERLDRLRRRTRLTRSESAAGLRGTENRLAKLNIDVGSAVVGCLKVNSPWEEAIASALGEWANSGQSPDIVIRSADLSAFFIWRRWLDIRLGAQAHWADAEISGFPADSANPLSATLLTRTEAEAQELWRRIEDLGAHRIGSPPIQVVASSGRSWSAVGVRHAPIQDPTRDYLIAKREAVALSRCLAILDQRLTMLDQASEVTHHRARQLDADLAEVEALSRAATRRRVDLEEARQREQAKQAGLLAERDAWVAELADLQPQTETALQRVSHLQESEHQAAAEHGMTYRAWAEAEQIVEDLRGEVSGLAEDCEVRQRHLEVLEAKESMQAEIARSARDNLARTEAEEQALSHRRHQLEAEIARFENEEVSARRRLDQIELETVERACAVESMRKQSPDPVQQKEALRETRYRLSEIVSQHERGLAAISQLESQRQEIRREAWRELEADPATLPAAERAPNEEEIRKLRTRAMQYADADPSVVHEYRQLSERQEYLRRQLDDLQQSAGNLNQIMRLTDREMTLRFQSAFESISELFSEMFRTMLRGGEARLEQVDEDGAIEVRAQLPGRRSRSSAAFSGGERALVASSLLFGVLSHRPTPFCILDEVDAALDESNVDRYLAVLREMSKRIQMIVVTHNRATMAAADVMYGLTIDDEGVSRVLSVRLDTYDAAM